MLLTEKMKQHVLSSFEDKVSKHELDLVVSSIVRLIIKVKQELDDGAKQVLRTILDKKYQVD